MDCVCLCVCVCVCAGLCLHFLFLSLPVFVCLCTPYCLPICLPSCQSGCVCLSVCLSICLPVLSICPVFLCACTSAYLRSSAYLRTTGCKGGVYLPVYFSSCLPVCQHVSIPCPVHTHTHTNARALSHTVTHTHTHTRITSRQFNTADTSRDVVTRHSTVNSIRHDVTAFWWQKPGNNRQISATMTW